MLTLSVIEYFVAFLTGFDMLKYFPKFGLKQFFHFLNIGCFKECVITLILQPQTSYVFFRVVLYIEIHATHILALV